LLRITPGVERQPSYVDVPVLCPAFFSAAADDAEGAGAQPQPSTGPRAETILVVEDNPGDVRLIREALEQHCVQCDLLVLSDGAKAIAWLDQLDASDARCPALVVLDLNLPRRNGREVLKRIRAGSRCAAMPVVILTSSAAEEDMQETAALGASRYIRKPLDLEEFMKVGSVLKQFLPGESGI
jgi:CheY-like chemotaxis protein